MLSYLIRRVLLALFTIWAVSVLSFAIIQLPPGDFFDHLSRAAGRLRCRGGGGAGRPTRSAQRRARASRCTCSTSSWVGQLLHGDLGMSLELQPPGRGPRRQPAVLSIVVSVAGGDPVHVGRRVADRCVLGGAQVLARRDYALTLLGFLGLAIPNFLLALILMYSASPCSTPRSAACSRRSTRRAVERGKPWTCSSTW